MTHQQHVRLPFGLLLALLAGFLIPALPVAHAAPPRVEPLPRGRWAGSSAQHVQVVGKYAYLALGSGGIAIIDVSNPTNFVRVGGDESGSFASGLAVAGRYAYVATDGEGLQIFDVSNPSNCVHVGEWRLYSELTSVKVSDGYAYVMNARSSSALHVIDVSNPSNCVQVGWCLAGDTVFDFVLRGGYAYIAAGRNLSVGLQVFDVRDPTNCVFVGSYPGYGAGVAVSGNYAYVSGIGVLNIGNPTNIFREGSFPAEWSVLRLIPVAVSGRYAYAVDIGVGLQVIDVSNPANCVRVAVFDTKGSASSVAVAPSGIYVADGLEGLLVLPSLTNVQFTVRVNAETNMPFTLEAATDLAGAGNWSPLLTTNIPVIPFDFVDFDVKISDKPQKFYRVRQP